MSPKRIFLALLILLGAVFVFHLPKSALGSSESSPEIKGYDDNRLALNKAEVKTLMKLEKDLKSCESKLKKLKDKKAKAGKSG